MPVDRSETPETCPVCGADVPPGARACPECGSDERTGWSERARLDGLGLPDEEFDYEGFVREEFGGERRRTWMGWFWWAVAVAVLVVFVWFFVR